VVDSISKTPVSFEVASSIVADAFGRGVALVDLSELTEGWFNAAYTMSLDDGRRCVLKVAPPPDVTVMRYEHEIMATEITALRVVRERTSVPVPEVLWSDTSCRRLPSELFVMEFCEGALLKDLRPSLDAQQQRVIDAQVAGFLRQMHGIVGPAFGLQTPSAPGFATWRDAFVHLFDDVVADGEDLSVDLPLGFGALRTLVRDHAEVLDEVTVPRFVHWDLWDANVFVDPPTLAVTGVIDFERALWADPLMEGQFLRLLDDPAFMDAYELPIMEPPGAPVRRLLYDLYLFVIMVVEVAFRHYPTDDIERLARARLATTLDRFAALA